MSTPIPQGTVFSYRLRGHVPLEGYALPELETPIDEELRDMEYRIIHDIPSSTPYPERLNLRPTCSESWYENHHLRGYVYTAASQYWINLMRQEGALLIPCCLPAELIPLCSWVGELRVGSSDIRATIANRRLLEILNWLSLYRDEPRWNKELTYCQHWLEAERSLFVSAEETFNKIRSAQLFKRLKLELAAAHPVLTAVRGIIAAEERQRGRRPQEES